MTPPTWLSWAATRTSQPTSTRPCSAQAALDKASLISYTVVKAPQDGIITKVDRLGRHHVTASTPVFSMMSDRIWVRLVSRKPS
jgi:multidrug resistance efflux pump